MSSNSAFSPDFPVFLEWDLYSSRLRTLELHLTFNFLSPSSFNLCLDMWTCCPHMSHTLCVSLSEFQASLPHWTRRYQWFADLNLLYTLCAITHMLQWTSDYTTIFKNIQFLLDAGYIKRKIYLENVDLLQPLNISFLFPQDNWRELLALDWNKNQLSSL